MRYLIFPLIVFWLIAGCSVSGDQQVTSGNTESDLGPQIQSTSPPSGSPVQPPSASALNAPAASPTVSPETAVHIEPGRYRKPEICVTLYDHYFSAFYLAALEGGTIEKAECKEIKIRDEQDKLIFQVKLLGGGCKLYLKVDFGQDKQDTTITFPNCIPLEEE